MNRFRKTIARNISLVKLCCVVNIYIVTAQALKNSESKNFVDHGASSHSRAKAAFHF